MHTKGPFVCDCREWSIPFQLADLRVGDEALERFDVAHIRLASIMVRDNHTRFEGVDCRGSLFDSHGERKIHADKGDSAGRYQQNQKIIKILIPFVRGLLIWINAVNLSITVISSIYSRLKTKKARCISLQRAYTFFDAL